jgi:hypothetical protein
MIRFAYRYAFHGSTRLQIRLGARDGAYTRFKAGLFMVMLDAFWFYTLIMWLKILGLIDVFKKWPMPVVVAGGAVAVLILDQCIMGSKNAEGEFLRKFTAMKRRRRIRWDIGTALFTVASYAFLITSLIIVRKGTH